MRLIPVVLATVLGVACGSGSIASPSQSENIVGTWTQRATASDEAIVFTLEIRDRTITGTGTYASGRVTLKGEVSGDSIHLDMTFDSGAVAQFSGALMSASELSGSLHFGSPQLMTPSILVVFDKK